MQDGWGLEIFARGRGAGEDENSRADDRADTQGRQRPGAESFLQALAWSLRIRDQLVDRLAAQELVVGSVNRGGGIRRRLGQVVVVSSLRGRAWAQGPCP